MINIMELRLINSILFFMELMQKGKANFSDNAFTALMHYLHLHQRKKKKGFTKQLDEAFFSLISLPFPKE
jgi:hypothetical protein